ncbi:hypothetical protein LCGC14_2567960, partial [marine sediment metagenome]
VQAHLNMCAECWRKAEAQVAEPAFADDLRWACELEEQTVVDINVPLARLGELLPEYYKERGWGEDGVPTQDKLAELALT